MQPNQHAIMERSRDLHRLDTSAVGAAYVTPPSSLDGSSSSHGSGRRHLGRRYDKRLKRSHRPVLESLAEFEQGPPQLAFEGHNYHGDLSRQNVGQMSGFPVGHFQNLEGDTGQAIRKSAGYASVRQPSPPPYRHTEIPRDRIPYSPSGDRGRSEIEHPGNKLLLTNGDIPLYYSHSLSRTPSDGLVRSGGEEIPGPRPQSGLMIYGQRSDGVEKLEQSVRVEQSPRDRGFGQYPSPGPYVSPDKRIFGLSITQAEPNSGSLPPRYRAKEQPTGESDRWKAYEHLRRPWRSPQKSSEHSLTPSTASTDSTIMSQTKEAPPTTPPLPRWSTGPSQDIKMGEPSYIPRLPQRHGEPIQALEMVSQPSDESLQSGYSDQYPAQRARLSPNSIQPTLHPRSHSDPSTVNDYYHEERGTTSRSPKDDAESGNEGSGSNKKRKKRTRVLMTHAQQAMLAKLWKGTKFPGTGEREVVAKQVGLTGRQVQVWFQNRRQTFRKQIATNTIPEGADPADYADLQASPRSRRLTLEASKAADRDRVTAWASSAGAVGGSGSLGLAFDKVEEESAMSGVDDRESRWHEPLSAGLSSSFTKTEREPRRGASLWEMDEDERLPALFERDNGRSSNQVSPTAVARPRELPSSSSVRESPSLRARQEIDHQSNSLSSSFIQSSRSTHSQLPSRDLTGVSLPQVPGGRIENPANASQSHLPPSLRGLTLSGPMSSPTQRQGSSFGSLEAHHYGNPSSAGPSPILSSHDGRGAPSRSSTDNLMGKGPRDWFPSSIVDRKWFGSDTEPTISSPSIQTPIRSETPRDVHSRFSLQVDAPHRHSEPSHSTSHHLPDIDHQSAKFPRSLSESQPGARDRRMSFERGERPRPNGVVEHKVARPDLPRFKDMFH